MANPRNIIGIGGSAGSLQPLMQLLEAFGDRKEAAIFVVVHRAEGSHHLPELLQKATPLKVIEPEDGVPIEPGHVYVAPRDRHMLIGARHVHLRRGPRENNFRPSIDPLFRALAVFASTRASGVILSGYLDDGSAGLRAIASTGGTTCVQSPAEATTPDMPRAAISALGEPDMIETAADMGAKLAEIATMPAAEPIEADEKIRLELSIAGLEKSSMKTEEKLGSLTPYNCPDCNGVLWEIDDNAILRFRCHTGHAYTEKTLRVKQDEMLERSLYESLRAHREKATLLRQLGEREPRLRDQWLTRAADYDADAELIEGVILNRRSG
ncbi:chemotaxis protein CheB [Jiella marina]|uniref:chemotaxis protein CheB n=1 Tax=Jiella sp. LLJ827 TaxID=2917712 RepID=UPI0021006E6E|nr:chemotaxis protein CheB [Jiella sp. LLJ827]MCQ0987064.1 chemotaxis protein CheB [Jiella sp. LLJ827]